MSKRKLQYEHHGDRFIRDVRTVEEKIFAVLRAPESGAGVVALFGAAIFLFPAVSEALFLSGLIVAAIAYYLIWRLALPFKMPKSSGLLDPHELKPTTSLWKRAEGIYFLGNDRYTLQEIWLSDNDIRTHGAILGTTGSGKTELFLGIVYNAIIQGSGFAFTDAKADVSLYGKIYSMARQRGVEDNVLVMNFQTGAVDVIGQQPLKRSNTINFVSQGSSGMIAELLKSLKGDDGKSDMWSRRVDVFLESLARALVYLRDRYGMLLDVGVIRNFFELGAAEELAWRWPEKYPGLETTLEGLRNFLINLPQYDRNAMGNQADTTREQWGYVTMQIVQTFSTLADTYGYIMREQLAEIDFIDVFMNRRIVVVLLPSLEKSPQELENIGRIVVALTKATMAKGLGANLEGDWERLIDARPTNAPSAMPFAFDEYGYYSISGFAVVPAQARSLGAAALFGGQDYAGFARKSESEAKSILGNTNFRAAGKIEDIETYKKIAELAGDAHYTVARSHEYHSGEIQGGYREGDNLSVEKSSRIEIGDLKGQGSGEWHFLFKTWLVHAYSFFVSPKKIKLRLNHLIPVPPPSLEEIKVAARAEENFVAAIGAAQGVRQHINSLPIRESVTLADGWNEAKKARGNGDATEWARSAVRHFLAQELAMASPAAFSQEDSGFVFSASDDRGTIDDIVSATPFVPPASAGREVSYGEADPFSQSAAAKLTVESDESLEYVKQGEAIEVDEIAPVNGATVFGFGGATDEAGGAVVAGQGHLNRDDVTQAVAVIEETLGAHPQLAEQRAASLARDMDATTQYPGPGFTPPVVDYTNIRSVANSLIERLQRIAREGARK